LIGNKSDLESKRQIDFDTATSFASQNQMKYFETSAKTGQNVEEIFSFLGREIKNFFVASPENGSKIFFKSEIIIKIIYFQIETKNNKTLKDTKDSTSLLQQEKLKNNCF